MWGMSPGCSTRITGGLVMLRRPRGPEEESGEEWDRIASLQYDL
jgi:hypothetical protein